MKRLFGYFGWVWLVGSGLFIVQFYAKSLFPQLMAVLFVLSPGILSLLCKKSVDEEKEGKWASVHIARFLGLSLLAGAVVYLTGFSFTPN